jgi:hypothetical protein
MRPCSRLPLGRCRVILWSLKSSCGLPSTRCELTCSGWHGTQCMAWACGWLGKVPHVQNGNVDGLEKVLGVQNGLLLVPGVWHGNLDGLERYLMYGMGLWMVWKGAWSSVWVVVSTRCVAWERG